MRFTIRQLEVFLSIARNGNTSLAAEELFLSQSAVSAALQSLERTYDISLFDRVGKRLLLNEIGATIRQEAESLVAHARDFELKLQRHEEFGHLNIGASFTIANHLAVNYLALYLADYPDAKVEFAVANSPEIVSKVLNYEVDLGMIETEIKHSDLDLIPWIDDELIVFCSPDHPLANKKLLTEKDLVSTRWILREPGSGARQTFDRAFSAVLPKIDVYLEFKHNEAIKRAVENGLGIGCLSRVVLQSNFRDGSLIPLRIPAKHQMKRTFYFVLSKARYRKQAVSRWIEQCSTGS
ncbi:MAG: LysR substrate-binding domain-containing protein [bacterium]